jgi:PAS domain S-box-containing protein
MGLERLPAAGTAARRAALLTAGVLAVIELLAVLANGLPGASPLLALVVAVCGGTLGLPGGIASSVVALLYLAFEGAGPGLVFPYDTNLSLRLFIGMTALPALGLFVGWVREVAEQRVESERAARLAVEAGERRYRELVDGLDAVVWEATPPTYAVDYVSRRAVDLFGYPLADWLASNAIWRKLIHPDDYARVMEYRDTAVRTGSGYQLETRMVTQGGLVLWARSFVDVVLGNGGAPPRLRCVMVDVTDRRRAEMISRENEERVRSLVDHAADAVLVHDGDGRFVDVNQSACDSFGYARTELLKLRVSDIEVEFNETRARASWRGLRVGERRQHDSVYRRKDGSTFPVEVRTGLFEWGGRPLVVALARDVSERKRLEQQLRQSQKMEAVGRLAGGVAHDFNNLLTAIKGHAELLLHDAADRPSAGDLQEISKAADRAAALTRKLLAFSRQQIFAPEILDLNQVVLDTRRLLHPLIGEHIQFETALTAVGAVRADRGQIEQVLLNLVVNARDAMPDGGHLTISSTDLPVHEGTAFPHLYVAPGEYVAVRVTDTGHGMDAETMSRIFEPFFTTKEMGKGSGLGLATAYGIVKQSGGYLIPESEPGRGASFVLLLPRSGDPVVESRPAAAPQPAEPEERIPGREVVLVVEDEDPVRSLVCRVLHRQGYQVLEAAGGREAMDSAEEFSGRIDLLISDVLMPEVGGRELARSLVASRPDLRVILMSGYTDDLNVRDGEVPMGTQILSKPFTPDQLARKVREVLKS